jgi:hypothetical protein
MAILGETTNPSANEETSALVTERHEPSAGSPRLMPGTLWEGCCEQFLTVYCQPHDPPEGGGGGARLRDAGRRFAARVTEFGTADTMTQAGKPVTASTGETRTLR